MNIFLAIGIWQAMLVFLILFIGVIPTLIALVDIVRNEFSGSNKVVWVLVVLFGNFIGALLYFIIGRKQILARVN